MNWPFAIAALVGLIVLIVVADHYERRAERTALDLERKAAHRRLLDEIERQR